MFDSSGPESKVRGTPQQIIDKYNQLARDAQLSGDRVAMENFQQHGEHYTRMLAEANREQEERREQQEAQHRERQQNQNQNQQHQPHQQHQQPDRNDRNDSGSGEQPDTRPQNTRDEAGQPDAQPQPQPQPQPQKQHQPKPRPERRPATVLDNDAGVIDVDNEAESGLVETPESKPTKPRTRRPRKSSASPAPESGGDDKGPAEAAE